MSNRYFVCATAGTAQLETGTVVSRGAVYQSYQEQHKKLLKAKCVIFLSRAFCFPLPTIGRTELEMLCVLDSSAPREME